MVIASKEPEKSFPASVLLHPVAPLLAQVVGHTLGQHVQRAGPGLGPHGDARVAEMAAQHAGEGEYAHHPAPVHLLVGRHLLHHPPQEVCRRLGLGLGRLLLVRPGSSSSSSSSTSTSASGRAGCWPPGRQPPGGCRLVPEGGRWKITHPIVPLPRTSSPNLSVARITSFYTIHFKGYNSPYCICCGVFFHPKREKICCT